MRTSGVWAARRKARRAAESAAFDRLAAQGAALCYYPKNGKWADPVSRLYVPTQRQLLLFLERASFGELMEQRSAAPADAAPSARPADSEAKVAKRMRRVRHPAVS